MRKDNKRDAVEEFKRVTEDPIEARRMVSAIKRTPEYDQALKVMVALNHLGVSGMNWVSESPLGTHKYRLTIEREDVDD